jgi:hypothetical protein
MNWQRFLHIVTTDAKADCGYDRCFLRARLWARDGFCYEEDGAVYTATFIVWRAPFLRYWLSSFVHLWQYRHEI